MYHIFGENWQYKENIIKLQEQCSITDHPTTIGTLLDGTECKILLDSGASKSFMSKHYSLRNISLHGLPEFSTKTKVYK